MTDDVLIREWQSGNSGPGRSIRTAIETALATDRAARHRDRLIRVLSIGCVAVLSPLLVWAAATAATPLVRGGYAMMALGAAGMLFGEHIYASWNRQAQPGANDSLTQIGTTLVMLRQQATLLRSGALWSAPIFVGASMVGWWIYVERSPITAVILWLAVAILWTLTAISGTRKARDLDDRRSRLEAVLSDLRT